MIELNLLPDVKKEFLDAQRTRNTVISVSIIVTIAAAVVTALLAMTVYGGQNLVMAAQTDSIKKKATALQHKPEIDKYLTVQNQLQNIDALHEQKALYSRAFSYIQSLNPAAPNNVALSSMVVNAEDSSLAITGTANNFAALSVFKTTLETAKLKYTADGSSEASTMPLFTSIKLIEASIKDVDSKLLTSFTLKLEYPIEAFRGSIKNPIVQVPSEITSDADRNAPRQVFGEKPEETQ